MRRYSTTICKLPRLKPNIVNVNTDRKAGVACKEYHYLIPTVRRRDDTRTPLITILITIGGEEKKEEQRKKEGSLKETNDTQRGIAEEWHREMMEKWMTEEKKQGSREGKYSKGKRREGRAHDTR